MTDLLSDATRALREADPSPETAELTRARIMTSLHGARQRRSRRLVFGIPIAAVLLGSTALASSASLPKAWILMKELVGVRHDPEPGQSENAEKPAERRAARSSSRVQPAPGRDEAAPAVPPETPPDARTLSGNEGPKRLAPAKDARKMPAAASARAPARDPNLELYRAAHQLHFQGGDPAAALSAWDAYLGAAPQGPLAPEARYNRALTLVRLGRKAAAEEALAPFADGRFGGYRREEAQRLIGALRDPGRERE